MIARNPPIEETPFAFAVGETVMLNVSMCGDKGETYTPGRIVEQPGDGSRIYLVRQENMRPTQWFFEHRMRKLTQEDVERELAG